MTVIANAAVGLCQPDCKAPSPKMYQGRKSFGRFTRRPQCTICHEYHYETKCPHRGPEWKPKWLFHNITKYNAIHKDQPKKNLIEADPPLRYPNTKNFRSQAKGVKDDEVGVDDPHVNHEKSSEEDNSHFYDTVQDEDRDNEHTIIAGMASAQSVSFHEDVDSDGSIEY